MDLPAPTLTPVPLGSDGRPWYRASLSAGAVETPGQSVLAALSLRDIGVEPVLAFRTGRMF